VCCDKTSSWLKDGRERKLQLEISTATRAATGSEGGNDHSCLLAGLGFSSVLGYSYFSSLLRAREVCQGEPSIFKKMLASEQIQMGLLSACSQEPACPFVEGLPNSRVKH
jgi:hypothetical protein